MRTSQNKSGLRSRQFPDSCPDGCHDYVTTRQAAELANVCERTISRKIRSRELHSKMSGHRRFVCRDSVMTIFNNRALPATESVAASSSEITSLLVELTELMHIMISLYHPSSPSDLAKKQSARNKASSLRKPPYA
jgi:hypothetical protein